MNVGVSIKNIGSYLKTTVSKQNTESNLKTFNSLNVKTNLKNALSSPAQSTASNYQNSNVNTDLVKNRNSSNLVHRHSNPNPSFTNSNQSNFLNQNVAINAPGSSKLKNVQQIPNSLSDSTPKSLPRIKINT